MLEWSIFTVFKKLLLQLHSQKAKMLNKTLYRFTSIFTALFLTLGSFANIYAADLVSNQIPEARMLIPLYSYPSEQWTSVSSANTYGNIDVVLNSANGPGAVLDIGYVNGIAQLKSAGVGVFGYVYTSYGARPLASVMADVDLWKNWYGVDGIFFDEASNSTTTISYYESLQTYITSKSMTSILNPGTSTIEPYVSIADVNLIYENDPSVALSVSPWAANYSASKFAALQYAANIEQMRDFVTNAKSQNIGRVYVTNGVLPNPWNELPPYLAAEAELLANGSASPTPTLTSLPMTPSITLTPTVTWTATTISTESPTATLTKTSTPIAPTPTKTATTVATAAPTIIPPTKTPLPATSTTAPIGQNTVEVRVANGMNDVEESSTGGMSLTSSDLELVNDGNNQVIGIRFLGVNVPKGATITNAYLQFKVDETSSVTTNLSIQGESNANALAFANTTRNVSLRLRTANVVSWSPLSWLTLGAMGTDQRTPNLAPIVQEIINQSAWAAGNSLVMIISGTGKRVAEAYEVNPAGAPLLHIEFNLNTGSTSTPAATATTISTGLPTATLTKTATPNISTSTKTSTPTSTLTKTVTPVTPTPTKTSTSMATSTTMSVGQNTVEVRIANGTNDVEESSTGSMYITSSDLELVNDGNDQVIGIRFPGVNVPKGVTITNAYLQFKVDETSSGATSLFLQGEANSNALVFTNTTHNVSSRIRTANVVSWYPPSWLTLAATGTDQRTPNLASIIQEIINQPGWATGNSLVVIISGTGKRVAEAYEVDPAGAPLLHIEYTSTP